VYCHYISNKTASNWTGQSQEFQESLSKDTLHLYTQHSRLIAVPTVFLISVIYWCSQHWHRSWRQHCTDALFYSLHAMQFRSYNLPLDCTWVQDLTVLMHLGLVTGPFVPYNLTFTLPSSLALCYMPHWLTVTTVCLSAGLKCCLLHFRILLLLLSQHWLPLTRSFCSFLIGEVPGLPDPLKSVASWFATLLVAVALCYNILWVFGLLSFYGVCASCLLPPLPLGFIIYAFIRWVGKDCENAW
jgi:hypothetical protein